MDSNSVKYGKSIVLTMSDGTTETLTGSQAMEFQNRLENMPRIIPILTNPSTGAIQYWNLSDSGCGFCKVAVYTPSATATTPVDCEDGMPNCEGDTLNPTTPSLKLPTQLIQVEVGGTATIAADVVPAGTALTYTSADAATATVSATGVVTGVKVGSTVVTVTAGTISKTVTVQVFAEGTFVNPITGGSTANK